MATAITPTKTVTFTVTRVPQRPAQRKTIERLMRMQPDLQRGLKKRARLRRQVDNQVTSRSGREWINRARATRLARAEPGRTFTLTITPQIIPDIKSVERYLKAKAAS